MRRYEGAEFGQHYDLKPAIQAIEQSNGGMLYRMVREQMMVFAKETDKMLLDAIIKKAKENGITDLYALNDDFIIAAIREKMEREAEKPRRRWEPITDPYGNLEGWLCSCGRETKEMSNYCPNCGAKMDDPKGD